MNAVPEKIDRSKLYGIQEALTLNGDGNPCKLTAMDEAGTVIIAPGATALASVSKSGLWIDKSELTSVKQDGTSAEFIPSTYSRTITLTETVSEEERLSCNTNALYAIFDKTQTLTEGVGSKIYASDSSYSDACEVSKGFTLANGEGVFMAAGTPAKFEMAGLAEAVVVDAEDNDLATEDDGFDFSMF
ncbi:MAG: hypothetical protein LBD73_04085 [Deferribacteraceae bacterium]|jgi:hypothetical protein|nr:hypothetical protein [Deferribacteraceae bacterium]